MLFKAIIVGTLLIFNLFSSLEVSRETRTYHAQNFFALLFRRENDKVCFQSKKLGSRTSSSKIFLPLKI